MIATTVASRTQNWCVDPSELRNIPVDDEISAARMLRRTQELEMIERVQKLSMGGTRCEG